MKKFNAIAIKLSIFILLMTTVFLELEISTVDKASFITIASSTLLSLAMKFFVKPLLIKKLFEKDKKEEKTDSKEVD